MPARCKQVCELCLERQPQSETDDAVPSGIGGLHESTAAGVGCRPTSPAIVRAAPFAAVPGPSGVVQDVEPLRPELQVKALT